MGQNSPATIQGVQTPTNDMGAFPDVTTTHGAAGVGWTVYECDRNGNGKYDPYYCTSTPCDRNYLWQEKTTWSYTCDNQGKVTQYTEQGDEDALLLLGLIPLKAALGTTYVLGPSSTVLTIGVLYLQPPPLIEQTIPTGTSTVQIAEQLFDLTKLDANVGKCAVSIEVDFKDALAGAGIQVTALDKLSEEVSSGFALAAADVKATIVDVAYSIRVDKTGLTAANVGKATITMKVGRNWADAYGVENIKVFRLSDGTTEVLPTTFIGYDGDYAIFEAVSEGGLSTFGLAAVAPSAEAFVVSDLTIDPGKVKTGETVTISAKATNSSIAAGPYTVVLKLNDEAVDRKTITLSAGESQTLTFTVTKDAAGTYTIDVNGLTGSLVVSKPMTQALIWGLVGGGVCLVLVAVGVILVRRRRAATQP